MAALGQQRSEGSAHRFGGEGSGRGAARLERLARCGRAGAQKRCQRSDRGGHVVLGDGQRMDGAAVGHEVAGPPRVGEERHRRGGVHEHEMAEPVKLHGGELGQIGQPLHRWPSGAALQTGRERLAQQLRPGGGGQAGHLAEHRLNTGAPADEQGGGLAGAQRFGRLVDRRVVGRAAAPVADGFDRAPGTGPGRRPTTRRRPAG